MSLKRNSLILATTFLSLGLASAASPAQAQWHRGGYGGYGGYHRGYGIGPGAIIGGALLGLGVGALLAAPYAAPPPVVYAPPPGYYPQPGYYQAPAYYAPPPYAYAPRPYYPPY